MEIANPRRILAVALAESQQHLSRVLKDLSGTHPEPSAATGRLAGTTHTLALTTAYYRAQVPVWVDLVGEAAEEGGPTPATTTTTTTTTTTPSPPLATDADTDADADADADADDDADPATPRQWADAFLGADAREVRAALGGVVAVVALDGGGGGVGGGSSGGSSGSSSSAEGRPREFVEQVGRLVRGLGRADGDTDDADAADRSDDGLYDAWDGVAVVAGVVAPGAAAPAAALVDAWDDACAAAGLEFVLVAGGSGGGGGGGGGRNEFGETTGIPRVLEALQANDWTGGLGDADAFADDGDPDDDDPADDDDDDDAAFDPEQLDFGFDRADFAGLREAIWRGGDVGAGVDGTGTTTGTDTGVDANADADADADGDDPGDLAALMHKLLAVREQGAGLPAAQRRRLAAQAVGEVMRSL